MLARIYKAATVRLPRASSSAILFSSSAPSSSKPSVHQKLVMAIKDTVNSTIDSHKVVIYSKSYCPYCKSAKALFKKEFPDVDAKIIELDEVSEGGEIQAYLLEKTGQRTVPNIFVNKKHVGGNDSVTALHRSGELPGLVNV